MTPLECARFALCLLESTICISLRDSVGVWLAAALSTVLCLGRPRVRVLRQKRNLVLNMAIGCSIFLFAAPQYTQGYLMQAHPSWWWHPFAHLWGWRAVECAELQPALRGLCAAKGGAMCLSDGAWDLLSGGALRANPNPNPNPNPHPKARSRPSGARTCATWSAASRSPRARRSWWPPTLPLTLTLRPPRSSRANPTPTPTP